MINIEIINKGVARSVLGISGCQTGIERKAYRTALMYGACVLSGIFAERIKTDKPKPTVRPLVDRQALIQTTKVVDYSIDTQMFNKR